MRRNNLNFIAFIIFIVLGWQCGKFLILDESVYQAFFANLPVAVSGLIFILLYIGITFFAWMAKDVLRIIVAFVFGPYISTLFIWIAEMGNAFVLFHFSRRYGRNFVEEKLGGKLSHFYERISKSGFWSIFALRAFPLVPFRFLDLAVGLTKIAFKKYFCIVAIGSPLRIFWVQFILFGVGKAVFNRPSVLAEYLSQNRSMFILSFVYLAGSIVVGFVLKKMLQKS